MNMSTKAMARKRDNFTTAKVLKKHKLSMCYFILVFKPTRVWTMTSTTTSVDRGFASTQNI
jgi:hypothetical protein